MWLLIHAGIKFNTLLVKGALDDRACNISLPGRKYHLLVLDNISMTNRHLRVDLQIRGKQRGQNSYLINMDICLICHFIGNINDYLYCKVNIGNINCAQATSFIFEAWMDALKKCVFWDRKCLNPGGNNKKWKFFWNEKHNTPSHFHWNVQQIWSGSRQRDGQCERNQW